MRFLATCSALLLVTCVACSGTSSDSHVAQEPALVPGGPAGSGPAAQPSAPSSSPPSDSPAPTTPDGGTRDGGGDGGSDGGGGGSGAGDGGASLCAAGSIPETEPNDTKETANALPGASSTACGALSSATDVDFFSFPLPAAAKSIAFAAAYSQAGVDIEFSVGGQTFKLKDPAIFKPGQTYLAKVSTVGKAPATYRLSVTIK